MTVNADPSTKPVSRWWRLEPRITAYLRARPQASPQLAGSLWAQTRAGTADAQGGEPAFATTEWADTDWSDTRIDALPY